MAEIPEHIFEKILVEAGSEKVSPEAVLEFRNHIEDLATSISKKAVSLSKRVGRKTVKSEDISLAAGL